MILSKTYIRATSLIGLEDFLAERGCNLRELLHEIDIPVSVLTEVDQLVSFRKIVMLYEVVADRTHNPNFGIDWACQIGPEYPQLGPVLLLSKFVSNLAEWMEIGLRYWAFHSNGYTLRSIVPETGNLAYWRCESESNLFVARQFNEFVLAACTGITRVGVNQPTKNPTVVRFQHRRPKDTTALEAHFRCPIEFDAPYTETVFDKDFLNYPTTGGLRLFKPLMAFYINDRIKRLPKFDMSMSATVSLAIRSLAGSGKCNLEAVAESLDQNSKQLQRLLAAEGTTFSYILDTVRQKFAKELLCESTAPISQIAGMLDYAGSPPFTLAFRRWTGQSPLEYRKRHLISLE